MHKIDTPGSVAGQFIDEDEATNTPGTILDQAWLNAIQAEVVNVIEAAGITLDKTQHNQLLLAIRRMVDGTDLIVRYTTTGNINLTGLAVQAGGDWPAPLTVGDFIMPIKQTNPAENGWYIAAGGTWVRIPYLDESAEIHPGKLTKVTEGANLHDSLWMLTTDAPVVLGSTALNFERKDRATVVAIQGAHKNLKISANGTDAILQVTIDDLITADTNGNFFLTKAWNNTIDMTTVGAGGIDVGVVAASTWYYVFGITKEDGTKSAIASLSSVLPTLSVGYTKFARIGAFKTDGTANKFPLAFVQIDNRVQYVVASGNNVTNLPVIISGSAGNVSTPTWVSANVDGFIPPTANRVLGVLYTGLNTASMLAPNNKYGVYNSLSNPPPVMCNGSSSSNNNAQFDFLLESRNIYYAANTSSAGVSISGWEDSL